jgi:predicted KAP-like P-loop ATPase
MDPEPSVPRGIVGDSPIRSPDQDSFGIDPFARAIARSIQEADTRDGLVYAVNGVWGSGKSSAVNLILHHLAAPIESGTIIATAFNPWWFSGAEALTVSFFQELRATVGKSIDEKAREAMASLGSRLSSASPLLGGLAALIATPAAGAAVAGGATLLEKITQLDTTVEKEHRKLAEALAKQDKKFLIVLDDIDRLTTDDALQVFKLIKSVGRLPNVIYLMAFDRTLAEKMVSERFPSEGSSYLEKVIQGAFDLPTPDPDDLRNQLLATVAEVMGEPDAQKMQRFWNIFYDAVAPLLNTPRDVVRLSNIIKVSWPAVGTNVDRADFLAIETMRLFLPSTYEAVRAHPDKLTGAASDRSRSERTIANEYNEVFLDKVDTPRNREIAKRALLRLFPRLSAVWGNTWYSDSNSWKRDRLICSPEHFPTYFAFAVKNDGITAAESDSLVASAGVPGATAKALMTFLSMPRRKGGTRAALALSELAVRAGDIAETDIQQFTIDLFNAADDLDVYADRERGFGAGATNELRIHWLLNNLLRDRLDIPTRSQIVRAAAPTSSLHWLIDVADRCKRIREKRGTPDENDNDNFADDETVDWLWDLSLQRIRSAASDGTLAKNSELIHILYQWSNRAGEVEVRSWTDAQLANDVFVVVAAKGLVMESWSFGMGSLGDRVARKSDFTNLESVQPLLDVAGLRERIAEMLRSDKLDSNDRAALERFEAAPAHARHSFP